MFIDTNSIVINGVSMGQYITQAEYQYNKVWGEDTGRNFAGVQSGTLIGIFPKLILQFRKLTKSELEIITPILDSAIQYVTYYDPVKQATITIDTYTGDYRIINKNIVDGSTKNESFQVSFISNRKRT